MDIEKPSFAQNIQFLVENPKKIKIIMPPEDNVIVEKNAKDYLKNIPENINCIDVLEMSISSSLVMIATDCQIIVYSVNFNSQGQLKSQKLLEYEISLNCSDSKNFNPDQIYSEENLKFLNQNRNSIGLPKKEKLYTCKFGYIFEAANANPKQIIIACGGHLGYIYIIRVEHSQEYHHISGHFNIIHDIQFFTPNQNFQNYFLSCSKDGNILLWNALKREIVQIFRDYKSTEGSESLSIKIHPSNYYFVSSHNDSYLRIWQIDNQIPSNDKTLFIQPTKKFQTPLSDQFHWINQIEFFGSALLVRHVLGYINCFIYEEYEEEIVTMTIDQWQEFEDSYSTFWKKFGYGGNLFAYGNQICQYGQQEFSPNQISVFNFMRVNMSQPIFIFKVPEMKENGVKMIKISQNGKFLVVGCQKQVAIYYFDD